jgi:hypothetical protein
LKVFLALFARKARLEERKGILTPEAPMTTILWAMTEDSFRPFFWTCVIIAFIKGLWKAWRGER